MAITVVDITASGDSIDVLTSASRTATPNTTELYGIGRHVGMALVIDVTSVTSTPSVTVKVQGVDRLSGKTWDIITSAAIVATGTTVLRIHPGITTSANVAVADLLPNVVRIVVTHADANAITYSVGAQLSH